MTISLNPVATIQLDVASTARVIGSHYCCFDPGGTPQPAIVLSDPTDLTSSVTDLAEANPAVIVAYGEPDIAATLFSSLRAQKWAGVFAYKPGVRSCVPRGCSTGGN